ncbi:hypothetical protein [Micromonospora sp. NBC_01796]|uniref:hypothetical protein n=1 Tax=Micromonospora sp. NBC_01796 TaxID=2975987 RepID=UPI002DDC6213|nr:hypothetical protein [Micromonospora sp. NBC_01796]WSA89135.1 hypothetical protein OIE47_16865 [Micromonospora sp. NBC_01796]
MLRECLAERAGTAPGAADPPPVAAYRDRGRADELSATVRLRGRRIRRRRNAVAGAATVALVGVLAGVAVLPIGDPSSVVRPGTLALPVDVVVPAGLRTVTGELVDLAAVGPVVQASRTPGGWLVVGAHPPGRSTLWYVPNTGPPSPLLTDVRAAVVAPDGRRVAWRAGGQLLLAPVEQGRLGPVRRTDAPERVVPAGFVGAAVLLRRRTVGADEQYDLWWPDRGAYRRSGGDPAITIYGPLPDGRTVVGQLPAADGDRPCLALLDAARELAPIRVTCALPLAPGGRGTISPDGRWLVANGVFEHWFGDTAGAGNATAELALVIDLSTVFGSAPVIRAAGPRLAGPVAWTAGGILLHAGDQGRLLRVTPDRVPGPDPVVDRLPVPETGTNDRLLVVSGATG